MGVYSRHHTLINSVVKERAGLGEDFTEKLFAGRVSIWKGEEMPCGRVWNGKWDLEWGE